MYKKIDSNYLVLNCHCCRIRSRTTLQRSWYRQQLSLSTRRSGIDGITWPSGSIYGVEYEIFNGHNNIFSENNAGGPIANKPAPCAFCSVQGRSTVAMIPARTQCPDRWTTEYSGYVVSEMNTPRYRSSYICWDEAPEVSVGGTNQSQSVIYPVEVQCGSLPCTTYISGRELTCVVCSKWFNFWKKLWNWRCLSGIKLLKSLRYTTF